MNYNLHPTTQPNTVHYVYGQRITEASLVVPPYHGVTIWFLQS